MSGWIALHRSILDWEWSNDPLTGWLFVHLLIKANYVDKEWRNVLIKRGQLVTGRLKISQQTGLTERQVRTSLKRLKSTSDIAIKTTNQYSIITICNYDKYQGILKESDQQNDQPNANERPAKRQRTTTTKQINNITTKQETKKEIASLYPSCSFFKMNPESKESVIEAYKKRGLDLALIKPAIGIVDDWLADDSSTKAVKARKTESHHRYLWASWVIEKAVNLNAIAKRQANITNGIPQNETAYERQMRGLKEQYEKFSNEGETDNDETGNRALIGTLKNYIS